MSLQGCCTGGTGNAVFTMAGAGAPHFVTIGFLNANRNAFVPIRILADSGSDITLLTRQDGEQLGFYPERSMNKFLGWYVFLHTPKKEKDYGKSKKLLACKYILGIIYNC